MYICRMIIQIISLNKLVTTFLQANSCPVQTTFCKFPCLNFPAGHSSSTISVNSAY